jgi:hypothetical protein
MSVTAEYPPQASPQSKAHSQQQPHLTLHILANRVGLYPQPPPRITNDDLANFAMTTVTGPPNTPNTTSSSNLTCLLRGPLDDFLLYSGQEYSGWLIDIAHDICDPTLKRGSLQVWDAAGEVWRNVDPTDPLTLSLQCTGGCFTVED